MNELHTYLTLHHHHHHRGLWKDWFWMDGGDYSYYYLSCLLAWLWGTIHYDGEGLSLSVFWRVCLVLVLVLFCSVLFCCKGVGRMMDLYVFYFCSYLKMGYVSPVFAS